MPESGTAAALARIETAHQATAAELTAILADPGIDGELFAAPDRVRKRFVGDEVHLRGLIEFSNICRQNCQYCGLRRDNRNVGRYRLSYEQIMEVARRAREIGYETLVLQSGEDDYFTPERMAVIIRGLKELDVAVTLSVGEKTCGEYALYKAAGADRFLVRIETTNRALYERFHPGMNYDRRLECLQDLRTLGFEVGTGCLVGLPGQTMGDLAADLLFFKEIDADMIGLGPFVPNPDTPLAGEAGGTFSLARKVMALARLLRPDANIPATTAMEALDPDGRILALKSGANVIMPNVSDETFRSLYMLYPGKPGVRGNPADFRREIAARIAAIGRTVGSGKGFRRRRNGWTAQDGEEVEQ